MTQEPPFRKKLIEVSLPLEAINKESAREKSIRHGHPSTLHLWWARRPLATCRAVLFSSLVDDPSAWPELFPGEEIQKEERERLFKIIEELVVWENSNDDEILLKAQTEIARSISRNLREEMPANAEGIRKYIAEKAPPVLDPFCGGGSIPLEAQRLGLKAHGSDLNPVAVLITKALIEIPPKFAGLPPVNPESRKQQKLGNQWQGAEGLAEDIRYYGQWMRSEAEKRIGKLYPKVKITKEMAEKRPDLEPYVDQELTVIAWLWARTVSSPNPAAQGAHVPLVRSLWLSTRKGKESWVWPNVDRNENMYQFNIRTGRPPSDFNPKKGTVSKKGAVCLLQNSPIPFDHIRAEGKAGRLGSRLMAIVAEGSNGRIYLPPLEDHMNIIESAKPEGFPDTDIPEKALGFRVQLYGMDKHYKLFTSRQLSSLTTFSDLIRETHTKVIEDSKNIKQFPKDDSPLCEGGSGPKAYADAIVTYLAFAIDKAADYWSTLCSWHSSRETIRNTFGRQALPMVWDYAECNPFSTSTGNWNSCVSWIVKVLNGTVFSASGQVKQQDATNAINGVERPIISTDPPYYDNIGYADLSDFFYIWLRRSLDRVYPSLFATLLTPKSRELIASPFRHGGSQKNARKFFENGLEEAFSRALEVQDIEYPMTVYYAFKQTEIKKNSNNNNEIFSDKLSASTGWETMLSGLIQSGFTIRGTWPIWTELKNRQVGRGTNALASSISLVCRPRSNDAPLATRREFISTLKKELPDALQKLQQGNIAPVDFAQAAIGPGMSVFTRYSKVMESDGSAMSVRTALELINQVLDEVLAEQEGEFDGDTRWALAWFEQNGVEEGLFGVAETLSKAKNTAVNGLVEAGIITAKAGKVKLISRDELLEDWDPASDKRLTIWEATQYLIRALDQKGEKGAAELLHKLGGGMGDMARDLSYRLYTICERKKWAQEALAYNSLIVSWSEITQLAQTIESKEKAQTLWFLTEEESEN